MKNIPYARQSINQDDIEEVIKALKSDWLTQGPTVELFELAVAKYCTARYACAVNSATSALHLAALACDLKPGGLLWTSPNTFVASANCARYCGAEVDFVDIDPLTFNMSAELLERKLVAAQTRGRLPDIVITVHFAGQSCEMKAIFELSKQYNFMIIEDASHAIGGEYNSKKIGCCEFSDVTVFSFHPVKIITTCEGGMIVTNNEHISARVRRLRTHGIAKSDFDAESTGLWGYQQTDLGYNYRMSELQAALGFSQLNRIDNFIDRRNYLAARYVEKLSETKIMLPRVITGKSAWHLYAIQTKEHSERRRLFAELKNRGILVNVHYIPVYKQPYYQNLGFPIDYCANAEQYYAGCLSLPLFYDLTDEEQDYVIETINELAG